MSVADIIKQKLEKAFHPTQLEVVDESHKHVGHAGARPEGETHFKIIIISDNFTGKSRIERQRMIYKILDQEMNNPIHALVIKVYSPEEK